MKQKACDTKYTFNRSASLIDLVYVSRRTRRLRSAYAHSFSVFIDYSASSCASIHAGELRNFGRRLIFQMHVRRPLQLACPQARAASSRQAGARC